MKTNKHKRSGSALVVVLGMLAVIMLMAVAFSVYMRTERAGTTNLRHALVAKEMMQSAIARHFGSDPSVINPSRIMRIGGTISWPSVKKRQKGYVEELTTIRTEYAEPREPVTMDHVFAVMRENVHRVRDVIIDAVTTNYEALTTT